MVQTLIANSGIQFFSREILLDANDGFRQVFYEWFDEKQVEQVLEYAYEIRQLEKFVHYSDRDYQKVRKGKEYLEKKSYSNAAFLSRYNSIKYNNAANDLDPRF